MSYIWVVVHTDGMNGYKTEGEARDFIDTLSDDNYCYYEKVPVNFSFVVQ